LIEEQKGEEEVILLNPYSVEKQELKEHYIEGFLVGTDFDERRTKVKNDQYNWRFSICFIESKFGEKNGVPLLLQATGICSRPQNNSFSYLLG
jgi:hypothetical protein